MSEYAIGIDEDEPERRWMKKYELQKLKAVEGKAKHNIDFTDETSYRTIQAYNEECKKNGLVIESDQDYPREQFIQL